MIPAAFQGAWQRVSIAVDGGEAHEPATVVWVQTEEAYADLRIPTDGDDGQPMSFAGTTSWDEPHLTWHHEIDLADEPDPTEDGDVGEVTWDGDDLVERGTFTDGDGLQHTYVEVWRRLPGSDGPRRTARLGSHGITVQAGDHTLTVVDERPDGGAYRASYRRLDAGTWITVLELP